MTASVPFGRPTDYRPEYCQKVIEWGRQGKTIANMCEKLDISRQTFYDWQKAHSDFLDATTRARDLSLSWWEEQGQSGLFAEGFNSNLWYKNMINRHRADWYESNKQELTGKDGGPVQFASVDQAIAQIEQRLGK
jgi:transposase